MSKKKIVLLLPKKTIRYVSPQSHNDRSFPNELQIQDQIFWLQTMPSRRVRFVTTAHDMPFWPLEFNWHFAILGMPGILPKTQCLVGAFWEILRFGAQHFGSTVQVPPMPLTPFCHPFHALRIPECIPSQKDPRRCPKKNKKIILLLKKNTEGSRTHPLRFTLPHYHLLLPASVFAVLPAHVVLTCCPHRHLAKVISPAPTIGEFCMQQLYLLHLPWIIPGTVTNDWDFNGSGIFSHLMPDRMAMEGTSKLLL